MTDTSITAARTFYMPSPMAGQKAVVLRCEIWTMLEPDAVLGITMTEQLALIRNCPSQLRAVDYAGYASSLASVRSYHAGFRPLRSGAAEALVALPNRECSEPYRPRRMKMATK